MTGSVGVVLAVAALSVAVGAVGGWVAGRASTAAERRRLRWQAEHDPLTGMLNRNGFRASAAVVAATARRGRSVAVLVIDLSNFKAVNDLHGHQAGDAVLTQTAALLRRRIADLGGVVGRVGGDEFAAVVPEVGAGDLAEVVESVAGLLSRTYRVPGRAGDQLVAVGASVGASLGGAGGGTAILERNRSVDLDRLLSEADSAMYAARRSRPGWSSALPASTPGPGGRQAAGSPAAQLLGWTG